jgi:phosphatidylinositol alpha-1,6-mannosyltransferase
MGKANNAKQRIFIATQTFPPRIGGMEYTMHGLARNFAHSGFDVTVLPNHVYNKPETFRVINIPLIKPLRIIAKRLILKSMLTDDDIVVCDSWKSANVITRRFKGRLIVLAHGQEYLKDWRHKKRIQAVLKRATLVVANSEFTANLVKDRYQCTGKKVKVIPPTYMLNDVTQYEKPEKNNANVRLISICRLDKRKGLREAVQAMSEVTGLNVDWQWDIIGNGEEEKSLKKMVKDLRLEKNINFIHDLADAEKPAILKQADLFVMPSYQMTGSVEGFGLSYIEAARYSVPAIAGNSGGSVSAVIDGETGWCVDAQDGNQLRSALTAAINSQDERLQRGAAAYRRFVANFSGPEVSKTFIENMIKEEHA